MNFANYCVLVAEDSPVFNLLIRRVLKKLQVGHIIVVSDGRKAWSEVVSRNKKKERQPEVSLVISDWKMPQMSGIDLLEAMKSDEDLSEVPFMMMTAENTANAVKTAIAYGISDFVSKPVDSMLLEEKIRHVLQKSINCSSRVK